MIRFGNSFGEGQRLGSSRGAFCGAKACGAKPRKMPREESRKKLAPQKFKLGLPNNSQLASTIVAGPYYDRNTLFRCYLRPAKSPARSCRSIQLASRHSVLRETSMDLKDRTRADRTRAHRSHASGSPVAAATGSAAPAIGSHIHHDEDPQLPPKNAKIALWLATNGSIPNF